MLWISAGATAGQYPPEWDMYTRGGYMYEIQSDTNDRHQSESEFKDRLLNKARTNLARQVQVRVQDVADLDKRAVNGHTVITYSSHTGFSTDVNLKLVETKTFYNARTKTGCAIAYINRDAARSYYGNELGIVYNKINNAITLADNYISSGFKRKAQTELDMSLSLFMAVDEPLFWMNIFGAPQTELTEWQERINTAEQTVRRMLSDLKHGTVICLSCTADIFGRTYPSLQNELKGIIAAEGCSFTDNPSDADWVIAVTCTSREYSNVQIGRTNTYFVYVDARVVIDKVVTSQRIFEDEVSVKGGHTFGYDEAAMAGYKDLKQKIGTIIRENIKQ